MGTKERVAAALIRLARLVPGIGSYQDKEARREADKRLRLTLAERLDSARRSIGEVIVQEQANGRLQGLDRLGRLEQKMQRTADAIRYASYGYSGIFDAVMIDENRLEQLYDFDIAMAEAVAAIEGSAVGLKAGPHAEGQQDTLSLLDAAVFNLDEKVRTRGALLRQ